MITEMIWCYVVRWYQRIDIPTVPPTSCLIRTSCLAIPDIRTPLLFQFTDSMVTSTISGLNPGRAPRSHHMNPRTPNTRVLTPIVKIQNASFLECIALPKVEVLSGLFELDTVTEY